MILQYCSNIARTLPVQYSLGNDPIIFAAILQERCRAMFHWQRSYNISAILRAHRRTMFQWQRSYNISAILRAHRRAMFHWQRSYNISAILRAHRCAMFQWQRTQQNCLHIAVQYCSENIVETVTVQHILKQL